MLWIADWKQCHSEKCKWDKPGHSVRSCPHTVDDTQTDQAETTGVLLFETHKHIIDHQDGTHLLSLFWVKMCESSVCMLALYLFKNTRCKSSTTHKRLWNYLRHTKEIFDVSLPQRSTGVLATLALLNKPCLFEVVGFEQTTKQCMLKYLQTWHLFNSASSTLQLHKRHLGSSEMQTGPHNSLCAKASKWAQVVAFFLSLINHMQSPSRVSEAG